MNTTQDIVARLWNLCHVLRDDGITYHQYVTELTFLLFLKMVKEKDIDVQLPLPEVHFRGDITQLKSPRACVQGLFQRSPASAGAECLHKRVQQPFLILRLHQNGLVWLGQVGGHI